MDFDPTDYGSGNHGVAAKQEEQENDNGEDDHEEEALEGAEQGHGNHGFAEQNKGDEGQEQEDEEHQDHGMFKVCVCVDLSPTQAIQGCTFNPIGVVVAVFLVLCCCDARGACW